MQGLESRVQGNGFTREYDVSSRLGAWIFGCGVELWIHGSGSRVAGSGLRVQGSGFRVQGLGVRV